jgi:chromosome segregation protein
MYLRRLEIQGFKTFVQKTGLEFVPDAGGRRGITAIVGPNGSGKSNTADALRWVMGEQSLKLLRGKKSEDVIFAGSEKKARSGFAEVTMLLQNDDKPDLDLAEVSVTRRLYRDGQSEYEVNGKPARLQDVVLLLAQAGIGQRTYSVIGQGMVDAVLVASPAERKEFFDEAFGLKPFQLKRQNAEQKLELAKENLRQTEVVLREIEPRLATLERQVRRLQERDGLEAELRTLEKAYYGRTWIEIREGLRVAQAKQAAAQSELTQRDGEAVALQAELAALEQATPAGTGFRELRAVLDGLSAERQALREKQLRLETTRAVAAVRAEKPWAPLPLSKIIESVDALTRAHEEIERLLEEVEPDVEVLREKVKALRVTSADLVSKLQRPAPEAAKEPEKDPALEREYAEIAQALADIAGKTLEAEAKLEAWNKEEEGKRAHIFETQHRLNRKRSDAQAAERLASEAAVDVARFETRRESFLAEVRMQAASLEGELEALSAETFEAAQVPADAAARLQRLRSQLEWIGGIDPETVKEHATTKERFEFLTKQTDDLRESIQGLEIVITELETTIRDRSTIAFAHLDREFGAYFKKLFGGGEAKLTEVHPEPETDEEGNAVEEVDPEAVAGIDIQATPPGKRNKAIALLSGGERALTSIALICAIMATNPSPFVVLDEVDAALDESNSRKFAEIIDSLADKTQFIVVTHNRATMAQANVLYGVTMGADGVSQLLSVKLEDVEKLRQRMA